MKVKHSNHTSVYALPHIVALRELELSETDPVRKRQRHEEWLNAIKIEQIARGQRTQMTYRKSAKCVECERVFDFTNPDDLSEWVGGHDCEAN